MDKEKSALYQLYARTAGMLEALARTPNLTQEAITTTVTNLREEWASLYGADFMQKVYRIYGADIEALDNALRRMGKK